MMTASGSNSSISSVDTTFDSSAADRTSPSRLPRIVTLETSWKYSSDVILLWCVTIDRYVVRSMRHSVDASVDTTVAARGVLYISASSPK